MQEREISLSLLFWKIVKAWRVWVIAAIVFAVMVPSLQYVRATSSYKQNLQTYEEAMQQGAGQEKDASDMDFTKEEQQQLEDAVRVKTLLSKSRQYAKNAVLMNIDPYQEQVLTLIYSVDTHYVANYMEEVEQDYSSTILSAMSSYAKTGLDQTQVWGESLEMVEEQHLSECIDSEVPAEGNVFTITVIYTDEEMLHTVSGNIDKLIKEKAAELSDSVADFDLILVSEDYAIREDYDLAVKQQSIQNAIYNYNNTLTNLTASMTEEQLEYLEITVPETEEEGEEVEAVIEAPMKPSFSVKCVILGAVVGIFLAVLLIAMQYIFSGKLHSAEELAGIFALRRFGVIHISEKVKGIDRLIIKMQNCRRKQLGVEEALHLTASNSALYCKKEKIDKVYITGTEIEKLPKEWIARISNVFHENGIDLLYGENLNYDAGSLKNAVETGAVLLVEQVEKSLVPEIEKEIRSLQDQGANIIGCIGVE